MIDILYINRRLIDQYLRLLAAAAQLDRHSKGIWQAGDIATVILLSYLHEYTPVPMPFYFYVL